MRAAFPRTSLARDADIFRVEVALIAYYLNIDIMLFFIACGRVDGIISLTLHHSPQQSAWVVGSAAVMGIFRKDDGENGIFKMQFWDGGCRDYGRFNQRGGCAVLNQQRQ
jgi:hypothetical protein